MEDSCLCHCQCCPSGIWREAWRSSAPSAALGPFPCLPRGSDASDISGSAAEEVHRCPAGIGSHQGPAPPNVKEYFFTKRKWRFRFKFSTYNTSMHKVVTPPLIYKLGYVWYWCGTRVYSWFATFCLLFISCLPPLSLSVMVLVP